MLSIRRFMNKVLFFLFRKRGENMQKVLSPMPRIRVSEDRFEVSESNYEIKRIGKDVIIRNKCNGVTVPVSKQEILDLRRNVLTGSRNAKIRTTGLSRAQLGRIVSDLRGNNHAGVHIRRIATRGSENSRALNYEILLTRGDSGE